MVSKSVSGVGFYRLYLSHILKLGQRPSDAPCSRGELNRIVLEGVRPAEFYGERYGKPVVDWEMLGEKQTLLAHFAATHIHGLEATGAVEPIPALVRARDLADLGRWDEWTQLKLFLKQSDLVPYLLFLNAPRVVRGEPCYTCLLRVGFARDHVPQGARPAP